jgi:hypothetical protein
LPIEPVTILPGPFVIPVTARDRFAMTLGPKRRWVSRAEKALFGERKSVRISADIIQLSGPALTNLQSIVKLDAPAYDETNGLKVWFLGRARLKEVGEKTSGAPGREVLTHPQMQTADGIGASMFMGRSMPVNGRMAEVGFSMRCAATMHDDSTEILVGILQSELRDATVQTNLEINARLNAPSGKGILLVKLPTDGATNGWGVVIHPLQ